MSMLHLHLLLNHVPVIGIPFVAILLGIALWRRNSDFAKLALVAIAGIAVVAGIVFLTGEPAEDAVERLPGISRAAIHAHEEWAEVALWATLVGGVLALAALARTWRRAMPRWITGAFLAITLGISALMGMTGWLGGQIRHSEIAAAPAVGAEQR